MSGNSNRLVFLCTKMPYSSKSAFVDNELSFLSKYFKSVQILTSDATTPIPASTPENNEIITYKTKNSLGDNILVLLVILRNLFVVLKILFDEIKTIKEKYGQKIRLQHLIIIFHKIFKGFQVKEIIKKRIFSSINKTETIFYSYWQDTAAIALSLLKLEFPDIKAVCRAHRGDIYFSQQKENFLACRKLISERLDMIFFIAEDGKKYQAEMMKKEYANYKISRLGTFKNNKPIVGVSQNDVKVLVSCSHFIQVKRVNLIIEALEKINNRKIHWIHFGTGILEGLIIKQAKDSLSQKNNISYEFKGFVSNKELLKFYANNFIDIFINVSQSEGLPVSIMEAMSYSIPVIATNVGGTAEIVNRVNGILLDENCTSTEIASKLEYYFSLDSKKIESYRRNALKTWEENYSAEENYKKFYNELQEL